MGDIEMRVAALETVLLAAAPWVDPSAMENAPADLTAGLAASTDADERTIRLPAPKHIDDARARCRARLASWAKVQPLV